MNQEELRKELKRALMERELAIKGLVKQLYDCEQFGQLNKLNILIGQKIREQKRTIEDLEKLKLDTRNNALKNELEDETESIKSQLDNNYTVLKKANLFAKNKIIQQSKTALFERKPDKSSGEEVKLRRRRKGDAFLVNKTSSVTDNLFQITKLMSEQVNQSDASLQALINSSSTVIETQEEIKLMGSHLVSSKTLLTKFGRRECTDKILIFLALGFFLACVLFCVSKRLW